MTDTNRSRLPRRIGDVVAGVVVVGAMLLPDRMTSTDLGAFAALPVELVVGALVLMLLPVRTRRPAAVVLGLLLGVLTVLKIIDIGFYAALSRPFDLVLDWRLAGGAWQLLSASLGVVAAVLVVGVAVLIALGVPVLIMWSVVRLSGLLTEHRAAAVPVVAIMMAFWLLAAASGWLLAAPYPVASHASTTKIITEVERVRDGQRDQQRLAAEIAEDRYADAPGDRLLTALRGKRVVLVFVESYGRVALTDPAIAPTVTAILDAGTATLAADGLQARSGYLTSSTTSGGSWLAHATLMSGLWIDNQRRYLTLMASDRLTLTGAFQRAGWRTEAVMPGLTSAWPEGSFYHYDEIHGSYGLGYAGPAYGWSRVPDQYTLAALDRLTVPGRTAPPTMAVVPLVTSHAPWTPLPPMVSWDDLGDGTVYGTSPADAEPPEAILTRDPTRVRADYARSTAYSLQSVISYLGKDSGDDLVMIMVGDHQPSPVVAGGPGASRDVPITVVAGDPAVLRHLQGWGWSVGLRPAPTAPVWRMDAFRDRFLAAFSATS